MEQFVLEPGGVRGQFAWQGHTYSVELEDEQVRVRLPFEVDLEELAPRLERAGYHLASDEDEQGRTLSQGWGKVFDRESNYPYWIYRDEDGWVFAFPPEDYWVRAGREGPVHIPVIGLRAREEIRRWLPVLAGVEDLEKRTVH